MKSKNEGGKVDIKAAGKIMKNAETDIKEAKRLLRIGEANVRADKKDDDKDKENTSSSDDDGNISPNTREFNKLVAFANDVKNFERMDVE